MLSMKTGCSCMSDQRRMRRQEPVDEFEVDFEQGWRCLVKRWSLIVGLDLVMSNGQSYCFAVEYGSHLYLLTPSKRVRYIRKQQDKSKRSMQAFTTHGCSVLNHNRRRGTYSTCCS